MEAEEAENFSLLVFRGIERGSLIYSKVYLQVQSCLLIRNFSLLTILLLLLVHIMIHNTQEEIPAQCWHILYKFTKFSWLSSYRFRVKSIILQQNVNQKCWF